MAGGKEQQSIPSNNEGDPGSIPHALREFKTVKRPERPLEYFENQVDTAMRGDESIDLGDNLTTLRSKLNTTSYEGAFEEFEAILTQDFHFEDEAVKTLLLTFLAVNLSEAWNTLYAIYSSRNAADQYINPKNAIPTDFAVIFTQKLLNRLLIGGFHIEGNKITREDVYRLATEIEREQDSGLTERILDLEWSHVNSEGIHDQTPVYLAQREWMQFANTIASNPLIEAEGGNIREAVAKFNFELALATERFNNELTSKSVYSYEEALDMYDQIIRGDKGSTGEEGLWEKHLPAHLIGEPEFTPPPPPIPANLRQSKKRNGPPPPTDGPDPFEDN